MESKIECCGRNGFFMLHDFEVRVNALGITTIGFGSKRIGKNYPIVFRGKRDDILNLLKNIIEEIEFEE